MSAATQQSKALAAAFNQLGRTLLADTAKDVENEVQELIQGEFDEEVDPYRIAWASRLDWYPWEMLKRTEDRLSITNSKRYSSFHQTGTRFMVKRPYLPGRTPSDWWYKHIKFLYDSNMRLTLRGLV